MKKYYLYLSLDKDIYVGDIYIDNVRGEETFSFSFSNEYLKSKDKILIDPKLYLYSGRQYEEFGFLGDMCPDRFGRKLIDRQESLQAKKENRLPRKLLLSDYLILVNDLTRMGALRLKEKQNGPFLNNDEKSIPPYIYIRDIEQASLKLEESGEVDNVIYKNLLYPGSSLGGARPKANIYLNDDIYIAKFPSLKDDYDVERYESICLKIAKKCRLDVPEFKLESYSPIGSTLLIKRFDRDKNRRVHYITMMTLLGVKDGESNNYSYLDLVDVIVTYCANPNKNIYELYKRLILTYLLNNTDNHLRNHSIIFNNDKSYELSPIYDVNPTFYECDFALPLLENNKKPSKESIIEEGKFYGFNKKDAEMMYNEIGQIVIEELEKIKTKEIDVLLKITKSRL